MVILKKIEKINGLKEKLIFKEKVKINIIINGIIYK
jgi:hypothetical protein